jgi:23S rRNA (uridine2552-2'-O)-methyltransferase
MARELHDHYFHEAKREGYRSRAAYKLIEIDDRRAVLSKGDRVLDCGCAPGSWLQVAVRRVGARGVVVGVDLQPVPPLPEVPNCFLHHADLRDVADDALLAHTGGAPFDVVLSDMAPNTTGDRTMDHYGSMRLCELVRDRAATLLRPGGCLVLKVLEGASYPELLGSLKDRFALVKGLKPKASRDESTEIFVIAKDHRPAARPATPEGEAPRPAGSPPPPPAGWSSR